MSFRQSWGPLSEFFQGSLYSQEWIYSGSVLVSLTPQSAYGPEWTLRGRGGGQSSSRLLLILRISPITRERSSFSLSPNPAILSDGTLRRRCDLQPFATGRLCQDFGYAGQVTLSFFLNQGTLPISCLREASHVSSSPRHNTPRTGHTKEPSSSRSYPPR